MDKKTAHVVLMFVSWVEFVLGGRMTDYLGTDEPLERLNLLKTLERFAEVLETKNINDITDKDIWR